MMKEKEPAIVSIIFIVVGAIIYNIPVDNIGDMTKPIEVILIIGFAFIINALWRIINYLEK